MCMHVLAVRVYLFLNIEYFVLSFYHGCFLCRKIGQVVNNGGIEVLN